MNILSLKACFGAYHLYRRLHSPMVGIILLMLLVTGILTPVLADNTIELSQTYVDDQITFQYPDDWFKCTCPEAENTLAIGNTETAPSSEDLERDEVQVLVIKSIAVWLKDMLDTNLDTDTATPASVLADYFQGEDITTYDFDGREGASIFVTNRAAHLESLFITVELGDGNLGMLIATTRPRDIDQFEDTLVAIAGTLAATDNQTTGNQGNNHSSGAKSSTDQPLRLTEDFELEDNSLTFSYPSNWLAMETKSGAILVSSEAVLDIESRSDVPSGEVIVLMYPTVNDLGDYPDQVDRQTRASTIVSYYASMAMIEGLTQNDAMQAPEIGDGELDASSVYSTLREEYDQYILTVENGDGDFITMFAFSKPGEMETFIPTLEAVAATFITR